jgi:hypothetical protein
MDLYNMDIKSKKILLGKGWIFLIALDIKNMSSGNDPAPPTHQ